MSDRQAILKYELPSQEYQQKLHSHFASHFEQPLTPAPVEPRKKTVPIFAGIAGVVVIAVGLFLYLQQTDQERIEA